MQCLACTLSNTLWVTMPSRTGPKVIDVSCVLNGETLATGTVVCNVVVVRSV